MEEEEEIHASVVHTARQEERIVYLESAIMMCIDYWTRKLDGRTTCSNNDDNSCVLYALWFDLIL